MSALLSAIEYYQDNEEVLAGVLDEMVERARPEAGDIPAFTFGVLVDVLERDHTRAVTVAALAIMRLCETGRAGESEPSVRYASDEEAADV